MKGNYENKLAASVSGFKTIEEKNTSENTEKNDIKEKPPIEEAKKIKETEETKTKDSTSSPDKRSKGLIIQVDESSSKTEHVSYVLTKSALDNVKRYTKKYNYKSMNAFVNDLFEHLSYYLE